jgi:hypothetical protein
VPNAERQKEHTAEVLKMTIGRGLQYVRGRIDGSGFALFEPAGKAAQEETHGALKMMANGDIRTPRLTHIEVGCCPNGLAETRMKYFGAICQSNLLLGANAQLPRKDRIGSMTASNAFMSK